MDGRANFVANSKLQVRDSGGVQVQNPFGRLSTGLPILSVMFLAREKDLRILGGCEDANMELNLPSMYLSQAISTGQDLLVLACSALPGVVCVSWQSL
jgi:hypothetical protein